MKKKSAVLLFASVIFAAIAGIITYQVGVVHETEPLPIDIQIQEFFFSLRNPVLNPIVIAITHTTDTITVILLCALLLALPNHKKYGIPLSLAALSGVAVYKPMKHLFLRARPDASLHLVEQGGYSFPSGHSVTSIIVYGLLIYLINRHCSNNKLKKFLIVLCTLLFVLVGPSRIYVGVHWPTDVLAGWCIGAAVLAIFIIILERNRGKNESM